LLAIMTAGISEQGDSPVSPGGEPVVFETGTRISEMYDDLTSASHERMMRFKKPPPSRELETVEAVCMMVIIATIIYAIISKIAEWWRQKRSRRHWSA